MAGRQTGAESPGARTADGRLIAEVFSRDPGHLNKAAVAVALIGLVGIEEMNQICKTIPLNLPAKDGCGGSADLGLLSDAVHALAEQRCQLIDK